MFLNNLYVFFYRCTNDITYLIHYVGKKLKRNYNVCSFICFGSTGECVIHREIQAVYHICLLPSTYNSLTFMNQNEVWAAFVSRFWFRLAFSNLNQQMIVQCICLFICLIFTKCLYKLKNKWYSRNFQWIIWWKIQFCFKVMRNLKSLTNGAENVHTKIIDEKSNRKNSCWYTTWRKKLIPNQNNLGEKKKPI